MQSKALPVLPISSPDPWLNPCRGMEDTGVLFSLFGLSYLALCGRGLSDVFLFWGSLVTFLSQSLPLYPSWLPMAYPPEPPCLTWRGAVQWLTVSASGSTRLTGSGMRSSQDRPYWATCCDGHSSPCEAPGIFALTHSGSVDYFYCSPLCSESSLQTEI